jgi:hypothetical protein
MKACCVKTLNEIQIKIDNANITCLMLLLAPWLILLGDTPTDTEVAAQLLARLTVEQAIAKLGPETPDEFNAVTGAMSYYLREELVNLVMPEFFNQQHNPRERQFWKSYTMRFDQEKE